MGLNGRLETAAAATVTDSTITWTTHEPTASYAYTIADGDAPTSTEIGEFMASTKAQITALIADVLELRTKFNSGEA